MGALPVAAVVTGFIAGTSKVRNFVMPETGRDQFVHQHFQLAGCQRVVYGMESTISAPVSKHRLRFDGEAVSGDVIGLKCQRLLDVGYPFVVGHIGYGENQVDTDIFKAGFPRVCHRADRGRGAMGPVEEIQDAVIERLYSDAQSVDPQFSKSLQVSRRHIVRICLEGYLRIRGQGEDFVYTLDKPRQFTGRKQRRSSTPKVKRLN